MQVAYSHEQEHGSGITLHTLRGQQIRLVWWAGEPNALLVIDLGLDEVRLALSTEALDELRSLVNHPQYQAARKSVEVAGPAFIRIEQV
jgi:hypothetical protein